MIADSNSYSNIAVMTAGLDKGIGASAIEEGMLPLTFTYSKFVFAGFRKGLSTENFLFRREAMAD